MHNMEKFRRIVQRRNGDWIAVSGESDSLKIGVVAATFEAARDKLSDLIDSWKTEVSADREAQNELSTIRSAP